MKNSKKPEVSIIIPTRNEEEAIAKVLCSIPKSIQEISEVIVVDSSKDLTPTIAKKLGAKVVKAKRKGKGYAMKLGAKIAKGEKLVFLDGDATDPPQYIPKLLKKLENYDLVLGSRNLKSKSLSKNYKILCTLYMPFVIGFFKILGFKVKGDPLAGFRAIRKETWNKLNLKSNDFLIETEMNIKAIENNLKVGEVTIPILPRSGGFFKSKFASNPKQWIKIFNYGISYSKDRIIKRKLQNLKAKAEQTFKKLKSFT